jgi:hypothetical protein
MVTVKGGGLYLTARRRLVWLRGEPEQHPDWTIDTYAEEIDRGKYINKTKVDGGYARYRANLFDTTGRLIATGTKTEWSERFMDFAEKAETGAIARALAVAGYGTEAALDLDEGTEDGRIADAPVNDNRPISIAASNVPGLIQGGRSSSITTAQINEIAWLTRTLKLGEGLVPLIESVSGTEVPPRADGVHPNTRILKALHSLTFEQAAALIRGLTRGRGSRSLHSKRRYQAAAPRWSRHGSPRDRVMDAPGAGGSLKGVADGVASIAEGTRRGRTDG